MVDYSLEKYHKTKFTKCDKVTFKISGICYIYEGYPPPSDHLKCCITLGHSSHWWLSVITHTLLVWGCWIEENISHETLELRKAADHEQAVRLWWVSARWLRDVQGAHPCDVYSSYVHTFLSDLHEFPSFDFTLLSSCIYSTCMCLLVTSCSHTTCQSSFFTHYITLHVNSIKPMRDWGQGLHL